MHWGRVSRSWIAVEGLIILGLVLQRAAREPDLIETQELNDYEPADNLVLPALRAPSLTQ